MLPTFLKFHPFFFCTFIHLFLKRVHSFLIWKMSALLGVCVTFVIFFGTTVLKGASHVFFHKDLKAFLRVCQTA